MNRGEVQMSGKVLREQLLELLQGGSAHAPLREAVADVPADKINSRAPGIPYSLWDLAEHMRLTQYDILDFIRNPDYESRKWPDEYWPPKDKKANEAAWNETIDQFEDDLAALQAIVRDPKTDFTAPLPHAPTYTILREILLAADHTAYHTGQIVVLRRALEIYP